MATVLIILCPGLTYRRFPVPTRAHQGWLTPSNSCDGAARRRSEARPRAWPAWAALAAAHR